MTDDAQEMLQHLKEEYVKAEYPSWQIWEFTPQPQTMKTFNQLRALGLVEQIGAYGSPWRLTEQGQDLIMRQLEEESLGAKREKPASVVSGKVHPNAAARYILKVFYAFYVEKGDRNFILAPDDDAFQQTELTSGEKIRAFDRLKDKGLIQARTQIGGAQILPAGIEASEDHSILARYLPLPEAPSPDIKERTVSADPRRVFVVHGRNEPARKATFDLLRALGLAPLEFNEVIANSGKGTPYTGLAIDAAFAEAKAVVVVLTGDDEVRLRRQFCEDGEEDREKHLSHQARPNVLFEAGLAFGRHPDRTILLQIGSMRSISDIAGLHLVRYSGKSESDAEFKFRNDLANRLEHAGCDVNRKGNDWMSAGAFKLALDLHNQRGNYE